MPLNASALFDLDIPDIEQTVTAQDAILYALSLGLPFEEAGHDELAYVFEKSLVVFPTIPVVLGRPDAWMTAPEIGVTRSKIVHGAQRLAVRKRVVAGQAVTSTNRVTEVLDMGVDKGGVIIFERMLMDSASREVLAISESTIFCRADGGFGGERTPTHPYAPVPAGPADVVLTVPTDRRAAMLYRLNGDYNPLHIDPDHAQAAGFDRPILHGLCTYGVAAAALRRLAGVSVDAPLSAFEARFSRPIFPGRSVSIEAWKGASDWRFRARDVESGAVVLDMGRAAFAAV